MLQPPLSRFARFAWGTLAYTVGVILWGAFVRATGSGAGCGSHWPLCDGEVVPRSPGVETLIEYSHRLTSGLALILVVVLLIWAWRRYPTGHRVRFGAVLAVAFMVIEALIGAGLVVFGLVGDNESMARAVVMSAHLVNTLILVAAITVTAWWSSGGPPIRLRGQGSVLWLLAGGALGMSLLAVSGAIAALGDTLFPSMGVGVTPEGLSPTGETLLYLRNYHPFIAIAFGGFVFYLASRLPRLRPHPAVSRLSMVLASLYLVQLIAGVVNIALLAPVWMQLLHLLLANAIWIVLVLAGAAALSLDPPAARDGFVAERRATGSTLKV